MYIPPVSHETLLVGSFPEIHLRRSGFSPPGFAALAAFLAKFLSGVVKAWYSPSNDVVGMPARALFHSSDEYYATEFHELAHSTGHAKRLHRENFDNPASFGSESYSKEELVAEMTAAMLCGIAGIEQQTLENSAAYLKTWIARLKSDSRLLVAAASQAQKAADFIQGKAAYQEAEAKTA
jgi:antirestriction protein ArdC